MNRSITEIRRKFLDFFHSKGHQVIESSSLVPHNDPTLLFTNSGMNQFKDIFLGKEKRCYSRAVTSQRCVRAGGKHNDLENVGYTTRHHTFFEMLGNFSFGDYFKKEAIYFAWELLTSSSWFNLSENRLLVTVYETDDETWSIWANDIGIPQERIIRIGDNHGVAYNSDNFWQMSDTGPCGPCSEIFYDHGDHIYGGLPGSIEESGDRYIEIWNIVFIQFDRKIDGTMQVVPKPSVDTGMGLERISAVLQNVNSNYEIDLFQKLIKTIADITGTTNFQNNSLRVVADHIRSCAFLIADGVIPSNENRGYVLRRIIRRAIRHSYVLDNQNSFFYKLVDPLIEVMGDVGKHLQCHRTIIKQILRNEEEQFSKTLERGLFLLDKELSSLKGNTLDGETAFRLYDTFGFPIELTIDACRDRNLNIDTQGFEREMRKQKQRAKQARRIDFNCTNIIGSNYVSEFKGYDNLTLKSTIIAIYIDGRYVNEINANQEGIIILNETPFYGESGGQVGDIGILKNIHAEFSVSDTQKYDQAIGHIGKLTFGRLQIGDMLFAKVDQESRTYICLNHSATHLLHEALRQVLGNNVVQKGSLVNQKYLRFDFSSTHSMNVKEIFQVEKIVNTQIRRNLPIESDIINIDQVKEKCNITLFDNKNKYTSHVRILRIGDFSIELCIGTHAYRTGDIGLFLIISELGVASGIRRIEAVTGEVALSKINAQTEQLQDLEKLLKVNRSNLNEKVRSVLKHVKVLEKELQFLNNQQIAQRNSSLINEIINIGETKLLVSELSNIKPKLLRDMVNDLKNNLQSAVILLATIYAGKIFLIAGITQDLTGCLKADELVSMVAKQVDGKGGGRPDIAQAGGTNIQALPSALASVKSWVISRV